MKWKKLYRTWKTRYGAGRWLKRHRALRTCR